MTIIALITVMITVTMISGCASAPPTPKAPKPMTWLEALSAAQLNVEPKPPKRVNVTHELWSATQDIPTLNRVESGLAEAGVVADSGGTEGSYQVTVGQAECEVNWREIDDELSQTRASRLNHCGDQLNSTQRKRLESSQRLVTISCQGVRGRPTGEGNLIDLHNVTTGVSKAARYPNLGDGELPKQEAPAPIWVETSQMKCGEISKLNRYSSDDHIRAQRYKLDDRRWAVRTVGLKTFGLADLALFMISEADLESAEASVIARADFAIRFEGIGEGQTVSSGSAEGVYVKLMRAAQHLKALQSTPEALRGMFVIVNPNARVDDLDAFTRVNGRFATP